MRARSGSRHRLSTRLVGGEGMGSGWRVRENSKWEGRKKLRKKEQRLEEREEGEVEYEDGTRGRN
jgi:hypothetical protein